MMLQKNSLKSSTVPANLMPESKPVGKLKWEVKVWSADDGVGGIFHIVHRKARQLDHSQLHTWVVFELVHLAADGTKRKLLDSRTRRDARTIAQLDHDRRQAAPQLVAAE
jgi:hypothetical protein